MSTPYAYTHRNLTQLSRSAEKAPRSRAAWIVRSGALVWAITAALGALAGCMDGFRTTTGGDLSGQVVVSGPLRGAAISVDQLALTSRTTLDIRTHLADTTTDDEG